MEHEKDFVMHSLRHTCITRLLKKKIGIEVVQKIVGHKDIRMTQRYNHPTKDDLKEAVSKVYNNQINDKVLQHFGGNGENRTHIQGFAILCFVY